MFHYRPHPDIIHKLRSLRKRGKSTFRYLDSLLTKHGLRFEHFTFDREFESFVYCSLAALKEVPFNGVMFPLSFFECTEYGNESPT